MSCSIISYLDAVGRQTYKWMIFFWQINVVSNLCVRTHDDQRLPQNINCTETKKMTLEQKE